MAEPVLRLHDLHKNFGGLIGLAAKLRGARHG